MAEPGFADVAPANLMVNNIVPPDGNPRRRHEPLETVTRLERLFGTLAVLIRREDLAEDWLNTLLNTAIADPA